jgi:hypothetical protein
MTVVVCSCRGTVPEHGSVSLLSHRDIDPPGSRAGGAAALAYSAASRAARACRYRCCGRLSARRAAAW